MKEETAIPGFLLNLQLTHSNPSFIGLKEKEKRRKTLKKKLEE
jgi:hypothetical protein